jgi:hypothetical protein
MSPDRSWDELIEENERDHGRPWLPHAGDEDSPTTLVGTIIGFTWVTTQKMPEGCLVCAVTDRDGGLWSVWINTKVLKDEFARQLPKSRERIVLRYRGIAKQASQPGYSPAYLFTLTVESRVRRTELVAEIGQALGGGGEQLAISDRSDARASSAGWSRARSRTASRESVPACPPIGSSRTTSTRGRGPPASPRDHVRMTIVEGAHHGSLGQAPARRVGMPPAGSP